jgi:hypothetical protein
MGLGRPKQRRTVLVHSAEVRLWDYLRVFVVFVKCESLTISCLDIRILILFDPVEVSAVFVLRLKILTTNNMWFTLMPLALCFNFSVQRMVEENCRIESLFQGTHVHGCGLQRCLCEPMPRLLD